MEELDAWTEEVLQEEREGKNHSLRRCLQGKNETNERGSQKQQEVRVRYSVKFSKRADRHYEKHARSGNSLTDVIDLLLEILAEDFRGKRQTRIAEILQESGKIFPQN